MQLRRELHLDLAPQSAAQKTGGAVQGLCDGFHLFLAGLAERGAEYVGVPKIRRRPHFTNRNGDTLQGGIAKFLARENFDQGAWRTSSPARSWRWEGAWALRFDLRFRAMRPYCPARAVS